MFDLKKVFFAHLKLWVAVINVIALRRTKQGYFSENPERMHNDVCWMNCFTVSAARRMRACLSYQR